MTGLHPDTSYTVRIRMLSSAANEALEWMWSPYATMTAKTQATIPEQPPEMTMGSFEVVSHDIEKRSIYVYWKRLPLYHQNAPNFRYVAYTDDGKMGSRIQPTNVTKAYALFPELGLSPYTFSVTAENDEGLAKQSPTTLFVPHYDQSKLVKQRIFYVFLLIIHFLPTHAIIIVFFVL